MCEKLFTLCILASQTSLAAISSFITLLGDCGVMSQSLMTTLLRFQEVWAQLSYGPTLAFL